MKRLFIAPLTIFLIALAFLPGAEAIGRTYTTNFSLTENPISEAGNWIAGQSAGNDLWGDIQTNGTIAFGVTQPTKYGDPTAILTGSWGSNQTVQATVKINTAPTGSCCYEAEVRLRSKINPTDNTITGYEVYCSLLPSYGYCHIATWGGDNGVWDNIATYTGTYDYLVDGDILKATISGTYPTTINAYVVRNGVEHLIMTVEDSGVSGYGPWTSGNPGIGFYNDEDNNWNYFGFSSFTASDGELDDGVDGVDGGGGGGGGGSGGVSCFINAIAP